MFYPYNKITHSLFIHILLGPYLFLVGRPAKLEEVIKYADFRQEFDLVEIENRITVEEEADADLLRDLSSSSAHVNGTSIHNMDKSGNHGLV